MLKAKSVCTSAFSLQPSALVLGALFLSLWLSPRAAALDPARSVFQYNCRSWTRQNGLPANGVNAIVQTRDGYLWLGTPAGPVRFDGIEFALTDLKQAAQVRSPFVRSLSASQNGGLWLGLNLSAFAFCDGKNVSFRGKEEWGGLTLNVNSILEASNGDLWIAAQTQAGRLSKAGAFELILPPPGTNESFDVNTVYEDSHGRVWLGTSRKGLFYWQDGILTKFPDAAFADLIVRAVVEDQQGRLWVGTQMGLRCYDANFQKLPIEITPLEPRALLVDRRGVLWVGLGADGLLRYWNGTVSHLRKSDGLPDDFVTSLAEDREGSLWVGTRSGLSQISDIKIPTFGQAEGLPGEIKVSVTASPKGGLWVASSSGFAYFDGRTNVQSYFAEVGRSNSYVLIAREAKDGDIYLVSGSRDVQVFSGGKIVASYANKVWPTALAEDAEGVVAFADRELYRVGTNSLVPFAFVEGGKLPLGFVFNMVFAKDGSLWLASTDGLFQIKDGKTRRWPIENGIPDTSVQWVCEDEVGVVWAGMTAGIARLKNGELRYISRKDGLFDNIIYALVLDDAGDFWAHSDGGLFRVSRQSLNDFADGKTQRVECAGYNDLSAVKSAERNQQYPSGCKTLDGRIWFPTSEGIVMVDPAHIPTNGIAPPVHIDRVRANGREFDRNGKREVPPGKGEMEFHFNALSFIAPEKVRLRYRLEGYDQDWVETTDRRVANYTNLKPGRYTFRVIAANADGIWNDQGDWIEIELLPHFYQTAWFSLLCGGLTLAALAGIYAWRVRHLKRKQQALQKARDLLETANTSLKNEIEERKRMQAEVEHVHRELVEASRQAGMAEVATSVLHNVGNVLNSVNIASSCVADSLRRSKSASLSKVVALLHEHEADLGDFLTSDPKGKQVPGYLAQLAGHLNREQTAVLTELDGLQSNIEHIKDIVMMQQSTAKLSGVSEELKVSDLVEDALRMNASTLARHDIQVIKEFEEMPPLTVEKNKVLQILVNLMRNAQQASDESGHREKILTLRVTNNHNGVRIAVSDNGVGISSENLARIFAHGFTTKKGGHGFGLHSGALAAKEMGGALSVHSDGPGRGATFTLELPLQTNSK